MVLFQVLVNGRVVAAAPLVLGLRVETQIVEVQDPSPAPPAPNQEPASGAPPPAAKSEESTRKPT